MGWFETTPSLLKYCHQYLILHSLDFTQKDDPKAVFFIGIFNTGYLNPLTHRLPPCGSLRSIAKCEAKSYFTSPSRHTKVKGFLEIQNPQLRFLIRLLYCLISPFYGPFASRILTPYPAPRTKDKDLYSNLESWHYPARVQQRLKPPLRRRLILHFYPFRYPHN